MEPAAPPDEADGCATPQERDGSEAACEALDALALQPRARARPSTAPAQDADPAQTWGRAGFLTEAQTVHLAAMRRRMPTAEDEEVGEQASEQASEPLLAPHAARLALTRRLRHSACAGCAAARSTSTRRVR
jgi:hypothetical protein